MDVDSEPSQMPSKEADRLFALALKEAETTVKWRREHQSDAADTGRLGHHHCSMHAGVHACTDADQALEADLIRRMNEAGPDFFRRVYAILTGGGQCVSGTKDGACSPAEAPWPAPALEAAPHRGPGGRGARG